MAVLRAASGGTERVYSTRLPYLNHPKKRSPLDPSSVPGFPTAVRRDSAPSAGFMPHSLVLLDGICIIVALSS